MEARTGQEDKQKEADLLSHAPNNKAFWETNKTFVEWSLCGKPQIPVKDEGRAPDRQQAVYQSAAAPSSRLK